MIKENYFQKLIRNILDNRDTKTFRFLKVAALVILVLYAAVAAIICTYGKNVGFKENFVLIDVLLIFAAAIMSVITIYLLFNQVVEAEKKCCSEEELKSAITYLKELEIYAGNGTEFIHEHAIITKTFEMYLEQKNTSAFKKYYEEKIGPLSRTLALSDIKLKNLNYIKDKGLKGLVTTKIVFAMEKGIDIKIELTETIGDIFIDCIDLYRIVGIFIDNAIEAAVDSKEKELIISMFYRRKKELCIIIKNTTLPIVCKLDQLKKENVSTKGKYRGLGLHIINEITEKYKNVKWKTTYNKPYFIQRLILKED